MPQFKETSPQAAVSKMRSGRHIDLLEPEAMVPLIDIDDIAHSLSKINRFDGHTTRPYSVAEHCLRGMGYSLPQHQLQFLLHDASEAYLGDVNGLLKKTAVFDAYRALEKRWEAAIAERFGIRKIVPKEIHETDKRMLLTEQRDLMGRAPSSRDQYKPFEALISQVAPSCDELAERFLANFYQQTKVTEGAKR
jgi:uncharacterized protein